MPLYAFGSNGSGQLGIGHTEDVSIPTKCLFSQDEENAEASVDRGGTAHDEPICIAAGGNHTLVLLRSGAVYAAGSNKNGKCGRDSEKVTELLHFSRVVIYDGDGKRIDCFKTISATWEASFLVDIHGKSVYVCGVGSRAELGLGLDVAEAPLPTRMKGFPPTGTQVVSLSSSMGHTVATLSNGKVYGWGGARKGQLGEAGIQKKLSWSPHNIEEITFEACQVACGREFTIVAGDAAGGEFAILGSDKWDIISGAPKDLKDYTTLAASWHGVYFQKRDGSLIAWGRNDRGQLPPSGPPYPDKLAVGSEHVIAIREAKELLAVGWGEHGNCGPETNAQGNVAGSWSEIPLEVEGSKIIGVGAGCATSWVFTNPVFQRP